MKMTRQALLLLALAVVPVAGASAGEIAIQLENGTDASLGADGAEVSIMVPSAGTGPGEASWRRETRVVEGGRPVLFEVPDEPAGSKFDVYVAYKGAKFFFAQKAEPGKEVTRLQVHEPTDDPAHGRIVRHAMKIHSKGNVLHIQETVYLENSSKRAYIGVVASVGGVARRASLVFAVPEGAEQFVFRPGGHVATGSLEQVGPYRICDAAIPPGSHKFEFTYHLLLPEGGTEFVKELPADTEDFTLVAPSGEGIFLHVEGLSGQEVEDPHSGGVVQVFQGEDLPLGTRLAIEVATSEHGDTAPEKKGASGWLWILGSILLGIPLLLASLHRPAPRGPAGEEEARVREFLIDEVARLDLSLARGELSADYHHRQREWLKKRLLEVPG